MKPALAILAGGRSTRMGTDKAHLQRHGQPLLARLVAAGRSLGMPVVVVGRPAEADVDALFLPDAMANAGPLAGIATALAWAGGPVLALAVDLPLMTTDDLAWLAALPAGPDGAAITVEGRLEPLMARWHPSLLPSIFTALTTGRRSPMAVLDAADLLRHAAPPAIAARLIDCDTPQTWAALPP